MVLFACEDSISGHRRIGHTVGPLSSESVSITMVVTVTNVLLR